MGRVTTDPPKPKVKRTKLQQELVDSVSEAINIRLELQELIKIEMADKDFPNDPGWLARCITNTFDVRRRKR